MSTKAEVKVGHTPGPWTWDDAPAGDGYIACSTLRGPSVLCRHWKDAIPADAYLIAAAPELLEKLDLLTATTRAYVAEGIEPVDAAIYQAQLAMRKAKGEMR